MKISRSRLKEIIREEIQRLSSPLLREAAFGVDDMGDRYVKIKESDDPVIFELWGPNAAGNVERRAWIEAWQPTRECSGAFVIKYSRSLDKGWGPFLYDVAMEYATQNGGGLTSDRGAVSDYAFKVWDYYAKERSDVEADQLDDSEGRLTPRWRSDDCEMDAVYADTLWDPMERDDPDDEDWEPWDPGGKDVLLKSPLSKVFRSKGTPTIDALKRAGKIEFI
ncbi:MAG: hypothetical protein ACW96N_08855 [Candidatus Thorarchaeota archaeon]